MLRVLPARGLWGPKLRHGRPREQHILRSLLFIFHVNDMDQVVMLVLIGCFADDKRLSKALCAGLTKKDMLALQTDFFNVVKWALDNNMELNVSEFDLDPVL